MQVGECCVCLFLDRPRWRRSLNGVHPCEERKAKDLKCRLGVALGEDRCVNTCWMRLRKLQSGGFSCL